MTQIENNKLIAEFMGWKEMSHTKSKNWMLSEIIDGIPFAKKEKSLSQMEFSTSWDWLMPVLIEIKKTERNGNSNYLGLMSFKFDMINGQSLDFIYHEVVEFIKWYNGIKKYK